MPYRKIDPNHFIASATNGNISSLVIAASILETHGDKVHGPWLTKLDHSLDWHYVYVAFAKAAITAPSVVEQKTDLDKGYMRHTVAYDSTKLLSKTINKANNLPNSSRSDFHALSLVDRGRLLDAIARLDGSKVFVEPNNVGFLHKALTPAAADKLAKVIDERAAITALGTGSITYNDGSTVKTLVGTSSNEATQGMPTTIAFTEEGLGGKTKVNIPSQYATFTETDFAAVEITHNFTNRILLITANGKTVKVTEDTTHEIKASALVHDHVLTVEKAS